MTLSYLNPSSSEAWPCLPAPSRQGRTLLRGLSALYQQRTGPFKKDLDAHQIPVSPMDEWITKRTYPPMQGTFSSHKKG